MAQYLAFNQEVEVNKSTILSVVNSMENGKDLRLSLLIKNGINPEEKEWFNQQKWLNAFKEIATTFGEMTLFMIGKAIIDNAKFPPIKSLEEGLRSIDVAYHMNHRLKGKEMFDPTSGKMTEGIGHYTVKEFNTAAKKAVMVCDNPYPSKFDEGIITQVARRFKPAGTPSVKVQLDPAKENRDAKGESCTFLISW